MLLSAVPALVFQRGLKKKKKKVFLFTFALMPFLLSLFYFPWFLFSYSVADKPKKQQKSQEMCPKLCIRCGTSFNVSFCALSVLVHQVFWCTGFSGLGHWALWTCHRQVVVAEVSQCHQPVRPQLYRTIQTELGGSLLPLPVGEWLQSETEQIQVGC